MIVASSTSSTGLIDISAAVVFRRRDRGLLFPRRVEPQVRSDGTASLFIPIPHTVAVGRAISADTWRSRSLFANDRSSRLAIGRIAFSFTAAAGRSATRRDCGGSTNLVHRFWNLLRDGAAVSSKGCGWFALVCVKKITGSKRQSGQSGAGKSTLCVAAPKAQPFPIYSERLGPPSLIPARLGRARSTSLRAGSLAATK